MKTTNVILQTPHELDALLENTPIEDNEKLLIQIFVSTSTPEYLECLHTTLQTHFQKAHIVGSSCEASIANAKVVNDGATLLSFTQFEDTTLHSYHAHHQPQDTQSGELMGEYFKTYNPKVLILFMDAFHCNAEELLRGLYAKLPHVIVCGGLASRGSNFEDTYIFNNTFWTHSGMVAVGLTNENLNVIENFAFDWMPVGVSQTVTKASGNIVYQIDNISAVAFCDKYLGHSVTQNLPDTGIEFPLIIQRNDQYIARAVVNRHDDKSLSFAGNIYEGERVQFGIGNIESILEHSRNYQKILPYSNIESIFVYSCIARKHFLGSDIAIELEAFEHIAPTSGFFTFGEFYNHHLLNQSNRFIALSEAPFEKHQSRVDKKYKTDSQTNILKALLNLSNATSKDLETLNSSLIHQIQEHEANIKRNLYYDDHTKLPNRLKLIEDIGNYAGCYLVLFNIDRFSRINYFYGFEAGDLLLYEFATFLKERLETIGLLYKLPSDELALVVTTKAIDIHHFIHTISLELKMMLFNYQNIKIAYTATIGVAKIVGDGVSMRHADTTVSQAKLMRKQYLFYEDIENENKRVIQKSLQLALSVREAIQHKGLQMHYQPIFDLKTDRIYSYEALARFVLDNGTILMPSDFLPILPDIHLSHDFVKMVIEQTFECFAKHDMRFSINLSIEDILDTHLNDFLCLQLHKYQLHKKITLEILETVEIVESDAMKKFITQAKSLGIHIAIDDFGSGFANFEYITKIDADIIKIDGSLIKNIHTDTNAKIVVETIVAFAQKLGIKTVVEYVHSQEVYDVVKAIGIDYGQGFYLGEPLAHLL